MAEKWDAGEMGCGELLIELAFRMKAMEPGQMLELRALDRGAIEDIPAWCGLTGHTLASARHPIYEIRRKEN
ncbi:MAG TPA: sulfurtransferase TusA family protein [Candidatus Aquilonibacter sp.]|nr:sulfurtransferase TusA family protein [Candidatus Aquilonibacter sp.]